MRILRALAETITDFLMEAEVTAQIGAEPHQRNPERITHRNGRRERRWDTRLGTLTLNVPKLREGGYVPSFIEHRRRSEQALISVIQEAVVKGVSTRKIEAVLEELSVAGISAGQVSQLCVALDDKVRQFREQPLGEIRYLWVDALFEKVRLDDRVESMAMVAATGVNLQGRREVLGMNVIPVRARSPWIRRTVTLCYWTAVEKPLITSTPNRARSRRSSSTWDSRGCPEPPTPWRSGHRDDSR